MADAPSLIIDGLEYQLIEGDGSHKREAVNTQPGDSDQEWEKRIENAALGWGQSRYAGPGGYDYGDVAVLHRVGVFQPGATVTALAPGTAPTGNVSFVEYWDGVAANRRLIIIAARHVYEVDSAGTISVNTLTASVATAARMGRGVRFKAATGMAAPKIFIPVQGLLSTDGFIVRTAVNTYAKQSSNLRASCFGAGKDAEGEDVLWRINENGRLNSSIPDTDPATTANWAGQTFAVGETSSRANDLIQQGRSMVAGKEDGAWSWDNVLNAVPITKGMENTPDVDNFTFLKDVNGMAVTPTAQGIIWIDGLEWGVCGPVSANQGARNLRGVEQAVSAIAGSYIYSSVYIGGNSLIFMGAPKRQGDTGEGPFTWHGPVAKVTGFQLTDLHVSTVFGVKLWWGAIAKFGYINLQDDFSPATDATSGDIYLPEGIVDIDGPGVIKDFRKAEFITRAAVPFSATNQWSIALETTPGSGTWTAVDGGAVASGAVASRYWSTETFGSRLRVRLSYSANGGSAELEAVVLRGTERPEKAWVHTFQLQSRDGIRTRRRNRVWRAARTDGSTLEGLIASGRKTVITYGQSTFTGKVTNVQEVIARPPGREQPPARMFEVRVREVVTS